MNKLENALYEYTANLKGPSCYPNSGHEKELQNKFLNEILETIREEVRSAINDYDNEIRHRQSY